MGIEEKMIPEELIGEVIEQSRCIIAEDGGPMERGRACYLIRRILKAFKDGELDKILGVVGRDRVYYINDEGAGGIVTVDYLDEKVSPDDILIAFRQEEEK